MTIPWFERDPAALAAVECTLRERYPTMHALVGDGKVAVRGTYGVVHEGKEIDRYALNIVLPENYPRSIPTVWETAERIPRIIDRHVFPKTGALCLGVPAALWITLGGNFPIDRVLDIPVRNYLIGNSMVEAGERWPFGEWKHGADGMLDFFTETIGTSDPTKVTNLIMALLKGKVRGHWPCPCGSGDIIRKCHRDAIEHLRSVPEGILVQSGMLMMDIVKSRRARAA
jgi:hypothetical protein